MTFALLALICAAGLVGPTLAARRSAGVPVVVGELAAGVLLGPTVFHRLDAAEPTFTFLADVGFAVVMFVAGSHVPMRDPRLRRALPQGTTRAVLVALVSVPVAVGIATAFGTGHAAIYAVLLASSSAALILPIVDGLPLRGPQALALIPQIAIADATCIVALPLVIDPAHAGRAAIGAVVVIACAVALFAALRQAERRGWRKRLHHLSERRKFAVELRINLVLLFALAAIATAGHISIMLAGFTFGLAVAAIGEPRRLARQLFAVTEGFFGPVFFVWLGASLDLRILGRHPALIGLGVVLGLAAVGTHLVSRLLGQPLPIGALASAQLGVPVAAATLGTRTGLLVAGEPAALLLGALVTIAVSSVAVTRTTRSVGAAPRKQATPGPPPDSVT